MQHNIEPDTTREAENDRRIANEPKDIPGWGYDANPDNKPNYPMKHYNGADHERFNYEKPSQQPVDIEVLHSNERLGISRVFGTSTPPSGLSGMIRRFAFKYSESSYAHWVPLVLADRIGVLEGIVDDLVHGTVPNIFAEKGWRSEWKYNRKGAVQKIAVGSIVVAGIATFLVLRNRRKRNPY